MFVKKLWAIMGGLLIISSALTMAETEAPEVLVRWEGITITTEDLERYVTVGMPGENIAKVLGQPGNIDQYIRNLLMIRSLSARAQKENIGPDAAQLAWQLQHQKDRWYVEALQQQVATEAQEAGDWEALARETYMAEPHRFTRPDQVDVAHILISTVARSEEDALAQMQAIQQELQEGGDFNTLAKQYSDDSASAIAGGELGSFEAGKMVAEFSAAAFALAEPGDVSEPVKTQFGYHLIKLNKKLIGKKQPFERVGEQIAEELRRAAAKRAIDNMLGLLRHETLKAERDIDALNSFRQKYGLGPINPLTQGEAE